ncbi:GNAT family N-acetyltransferase [Microbacterium sp. GXF7504]
MELRVDDLTHPAVQRLIGEHLDDMHAGSPPESVHALALSALTHPDITVWSAWEGDRLLGVGALKRLDARGGEVKSMRTTLEARGTGVGRAILRRIVTAARAEGMTALWLETGSGPQFLPARRLYESEGFARCGPFADYTDDPLSVYFTLPL